MFKPDKQTRLKASILAAALAAIPWGAHAAGLGRLAVLSPLGQPLRAELDLTATREELSSLAARVPKADAFKQAGIDYMPVLANIRVSVEKRANGQPFLRVQTDRPVNDPFIDMLIEVTWSSGRLVREYTFLLDPPEAVKVVPEPPAAAPVATPVAPAAAPAVQAAPEPTTPAVPAAEAAKAPAAPEAAAKTTTTAGTRQVKPGDTLAKIALETKPEGVSLEQMLVALFRGNQDAFVGGNMNRLKAGKILNIPESEAVTGVGAKEAHKIVVAQAADFNAYRKKLAATVATTAPAKEEAPQQAVAGKITPKVEEKAPAPAAKDKLAVSRTEAAKAADTGRVTALQEDLVAREKALKEANSRIADLEKNVSDLKKLAELKSQAGAQLQQQAQAPAPEAKKPEAAPAAAPAAKPAEPAEAAKAPEKPAEAAAEPVKPAEEAKPAEAPAPVPLPPAPAAKKPLPPPPPPPPAEPPSFFEDNALLVLGGGGVLALLAGYLGYNAWRRKRESGDMGTTSRITEGELTANSVFGSTGGQSVDTSANVSLQTDFSQSGMAAINADEGVDPVAEADVYMAYGRDAQAEEILLDALKTDPSRHAIHLKLLEIYAGRKSLKQFETLATDLYGQTGGTGPDWDKAAALGRGLDPTNPLYGGGEAPAPAAAAAKTMEELAATTLVVPPPVQAEKMSDTVTMPGQLAQMAAAAPPPPPAPEEVSSLDFDLDLGIAPEPSA
ncbi:MAG TPA: FimV/HubP family polar landmark protein, partial [Rhodocyclaceae bacterium]|nr:FimV/HubP family polar landmark protein [Rhodocyclaceae bacterium]